MVRFFSLFMTLCLISQCPCYALTSDDLTLEEKVGQLLMVSFRGETLTPETASLIHESHVGGIIYYTWANGLQSPAQIYSLSAELQKLASQTRLAIPLLIATDQEGGVVVRLKEGFTEFPGNRALGATEDPQLAEDCAYVMGKEMSSVGVNITLAPVVDINTNPYNPIVGVRAFGDTPTKVIAFAEHALTGFHQAEVLTVLKHFPGHGDVDVDSHVGLPVLRKSKEALLESDLKPFYALYSKTDMIMTGHLLVPALDPTYCTTLSKASLRKVLRQEIGFNGLIISDSLVMQGVLDQAQTVEEAAILAFDAGCDILCLGGRQLIGSNAHELTVEDIKRVHMALVDAFKAGRISTDRLDESVNRILAAKSKSTFSNRNQMPLEKLKSPSHMRLAEKVAEHSVKYVRNTLPGINLLEMQTAVFIPSSQYQPFMERLPKCQLHRYADRFISLSALQQMLQQSVDADAIVFFSYNAWKNPYQQRLIDALLELEKPFLLVCLRDPIDAELFPQAHVAITTFSPSDPSLKAACQLLWREHVAP